jgi:hypothetical protein
MIDQGLYIIGLFIPSSNLIHTSFMPILYMRKLNVREPKHIGLLP